eukprot:gene7207-12882_t
MFSILIDECKDSTGYEELVIWLRFVDDTGYIQEWSFELTHFKEMDANAILTEGISLVFEWKNMSASLLALRASVMSGSNEDVAAKLTKFIPA